MSLDAYQWAWRQQVKPAMKIILLALADRADERHQCFPSIDRLEHDTGLNRKTIISSLKKLSSVEIGLVKVEKSKGRNGQFLRNKYTLIGVKNRHDLESETAADADDKPDTKNGTRHGENPVPETGYGHDPKTGHGPCPKNGQNHVPKTAKTMSQKRDTNLPVNLPVNLPKYIRAREFAEFWEMRKKLKAVNSEQAMKLILTELEKIRAMGQDPNEAINRSIVNSWKSVYPEKVKNETRQQSGQPETHHQRITRLIHSGC